MARQLTDVSGVAELLCFTAHQVYKLVRRPDDPLPHKKIGKHLRFDIEKVWCWFDRQPGKDREDVHF
jgi:hypothetical protein